MALSKEVKETNQQRYAGAIAMKPTYTCFLDPELGFEPHLLDDLCDACGRPYGFPLTFAPKSIAGFRVLAPISRGFYGATYRAVRENDFVSADRVIKVVPKSLYELAGKNFRQECADHLTIARHQPSLAQLLGAGEADVQFGDVTISCFWAELEYIEGPTLLEVLQSPNVVAPLTIAQIAIDLFLILAVFAAHERAHNDLHEGNIIVQRLPATEQRLDALDPAVRAIAIDFGSVSDRSKSSDIRLSDQHSVAHLLLDFADRILQSPSKISDRDFRLASTLSDLRHMLLPPAGNARRLEPLDCIYQIRNAVQFAESPWKGPETMRKLGEGYNAQLLQPGLIRRLLNDPGGWEKEISRPGPQLITGMRGCGKTMLLRALEFHARVEGYGKSDRSNNSDPATKLLADSFVGLYVSSGRLLDLAKNPKDANALLLLSFARQAIRAVRHLHEVLPAMLDPQATRIIATAVAEVVVGAEDMADAISDVSLEQQIELSLHAMAKGKSEYHIELSTATAFETLASAVRKSSVLWNEASVFYLLDDVSTRFLQPDTIATLLSELLFMNPICGFKMTTELQTLDQILRSPGNIEQAREGRDYHVFNLGQAVNERLERHGWRFVDEILHKRAELAGVSTRDRPRDLLGSEQLESIAQRIHTAEDTSRKKKAIYSGINALAAVCVGDIGDVIALYERILESAPENMIPIPAEIQSKCYQEFCTSKLFELNNRDGRLKSFAMSFSNASHKLLMASGKTATDPLRLRQYTKIYVRITSGDIERQHEQLRRLIDAGVFVRDGGLPRLKTRDNDPVHTTILAFRKLLGLSTYIGLSNRDRFELSGALLERWLAEPDESGQLLSESLGYPRFTDIEEPEVIAESAEQYVDNADTVTGTAPNTNASRLALFPILEAKPSEPEAAKAAYQTPVIREITLGDLKSAAIKTVILGLGFEDRTLNSAERILPSLSPDRIGLFRYKMPGQSIAIRALLNPSAYDVYATEDPADLIRKDDLGHALIDVSGLSKPAIFHTINNALDRDRTVYVVHTAAHTYWPRDNDIREIFSAHEDDDLWSKADAIPDILAGEIRPYSYIALLRRSIESGRGRVLVASASPKHRRLISLLEHLGRDYARYEILSVDGNSERDKLTQYAARLAAFDRAEAHTVSLPSNDPNRLIEHVTMRYQQFFHAGYEFELGLTGSKLHAMALSALSVALKVTEIWYVSPKEFDPSHFTQGTGATKVFEIRLGRP